MLKMDLQLFNDNGVFNLQHEHKFEIDITPDGESETMEEIAEGISDFEPDPNDEVDQAFYLSGEGHADSDVTGQQLIISFEGHRYLGDPAQDFIYEKVNKVGKARRTKFKWTKPSGEEIEGNVTLANITGPSGPANEKGSISFEVHFNGKPTVTESGE